MIDNYEQTVALIEKMKANLPIPMNSEKGLLIMLRDGKIKTPQGYRFQIEDVLYMGDEGGIICRLSLPDGAKEVFMTSLTHLRVPAVHPLCKEIESYQKKRIKIDFIGC